MELEDIVHVLEVDRESYTLPWPANAYRREISHNRNARYVVLRDVSPESQEETRHQQADQRPRLPLPFFRWPSKPSEEKALKVGRILGYAGMWIVLDESHITTIAVRTEHRGRGLGEVLLANLVELAAEAQARHVTLEVRVSNEIAQNLYRKYGFELQGRRPRYYSDNNEDAYLMTTGDIRTAEYRHQFESLVERLQGRLGQGGDVLVRAPAFGNVSVHTPDAR
jgi:ribosomal-protein-alanine N-acetyltransferase